MSDGDTLHKTKPYKPIEELRPKGERHKPHRFVLTRFKDIKPETGQTYLVKNLISSTGLAVVWGAPKCGKSFWTFDMVMHVALGWDYRGHKVKQGPVVYCALEGARGFKNRTEAFRQHKKGGEQGAYDPPFFLMATHLSLVTDKAQFVKEVRAQIGDALPVAVVIDTLNRSITGSESDDEAMGAYVLAADAIREAFNCVVIIVHHCGHGQERPRGHSSLIGAVDEQISVKKDQATGVIVAELELAKDSETGLKFTSRLKVVDIGIDGDGDPITTCVVEYIEGEAETTAKKPPVKQLIDSAKVALKAFERALAEVGKSSPGSNTIPADVRGVLIDDWRRYAYQMGISKGKERAQRGAFERGSEALIAADIVSVWDEFVWKK